jgi:ATP-binding cassette subfamily B protein
MIWRAILGQVTLGEVALFYQAFSQGQRLMRTLLDSVGQLYYNVLFLGNLFEFLDLCSAVRDPADARQAAGDGGWREHSFQRMSSQVSGQHPHCAARA